MTGELVTVEDGPRHEDWWITICFLNIWTDIMFQAMPEELFKNGIIVGPGLWLQYRYMILRMYGPLYKYLLMADATSCELLKNAYLAERYLK